MIEQNFVEINQIDGFLSFIWSIDWRDPWLLGLFTFHITIFIMAIFTRNYGNFQALLFFCLLLLVYFSESINKLASSNWKIFSRQQYFDSNGLFISVVFSMPILLNCMLMVGSWLYQSTQLMKNLKIAQLEERIKNEKKLEKSKSKEE
ncbi:transmembrane protein 18 [Tribolium castaneum]|uniref:Transmembrane protein 18 n=1 Tax=Tribolium castaneum TaxID=7070 RepID=D6WLC5_TRICA|nr:PREDICTED: transmembrane protein 18 [Tribolium castaneum]XP_044267220.1 transmembrane protein 18 [Tribolium madens]EFA03470.1 Transmembrane protein 18-like Protein [Tribolium castaneum]|eukprot:XP_008193738.1 PREDICTED: transmembrane protein 18 [Tribolium castaneum]